MSRITSIVEYQAEALKTAREGTSVEHILASSMGLSGEAAELLAESYSAGLLSATGLAISTGRVTELGKKQVFHDHEVSRERVKKELGDVAWYWALACKAWGLDPSEVLGANIDKLRERYGEQFSADASVNRPEGW